MERFGMGAGSHDDGVRRHRKYDRMPIQMFDQLRMGHRNVDVQSFGQRSVFDDRGSMYCRNGFMRQRSDRLRHYQNVVVYRAIRRNDSKLLEGELGVCNWKMEHSRMYTILFVFSSMHRIPGKLMIL